MLHKHEKNVAALIGIDEATEDMPGVGRTLNGLWRICFFYFLVPSNVTAVS